MTMDLIAFVLFEPRFLEAMLLYDRMQAIIGGWTWSWDLGWVDDNPRDAAWAKRVFGNN